MLASENDIRKFTDFEISSWLKLTENYDALAGRITLQVADAALKAVRIGHGSTLLDVATGPGYIAAKAAHLGADPTGIDFSAEMIDVARNLSPGMKLEVGTAENLRFSDSTFDAVVCAFGMLHFPRPGRAMAEASRVLRSGGRYAFTVWVTPTKDKLFGLIGSVMQQYADPSTPRPAGPTMFMLSDPWVCAALMDVAGFVDVQIEEIPCFFEPASTREIFEFMRKCTVRQAHLYSHQPPEKQREIETALTEAGANAMAAGNGRIPCPAILVSGTKP